MSNVALVAFLVALCGPVCWCEINNRPIIGVLSQELTTKMSQNYGVHKSYIASSYVQFIHGAGARAAPILIGESEEYYKQILKYINGVLLPGGAVWFDDKKGGYVEAGRLILDLAEDMNANGDVFPVWGTCLGLELMTYHENGGKDLRINCSSYNVASNVMFTPEASQSRMFSNASKELKGYMTNSNTTTNFHRFCITPEDLAKSDLGKIWTPLSTSIDVNGLKYVSTFEHKTRPYFGTQWHPEKPLYEWGHYQIPHDENSAMVSQYMANFFVNQVRNNNHSFPSEEIERQHLIYKFPAVFGNATSTYTQLYFFD